MIQNYNELSMFENLKAKKFLMKITDEEMESYIRKK